MLAYVCLGEEDAEIAHDRKEHLLLTTSSLPNTFVDFIVGVDHFVRLRGGNLPSLCRALLKPEGLDRTLASNPEMRWLYHLHRPIRDEIDRVSERIGLSRDEVLAILLRRCSFPADLPELDALLNEP